MTFTTTTTTEGKTIQTFTVILYWEEDVYVAECPEVGTASQGETIEEALANLKEATELYLEEFPMPQLARRLITTLEVTYAKVAES
jgi:predicted RNase H-like HicB family nuclease